MSSPVFKRMNGNSGRQQRPQGAQRGQQNDPQFMSFANQLSEFGRNFRGDPGQMITEAVNDGRINRKQYEMVENMARKIQNMLVGMGF